MLEYSTAAALLKFNAKKNKQQQHEPRHALSNGKMTTEKKKKNPSQSTVQQKGTVEEVISLSNMRGQPFKCVVGAPNQVSQGAVIFKSDTGDPPHLRGVIMHQSARCISKLPVMVCALGFIFPIKSANYMIIRSTVPRPFWKTDWAVHFVFAQR